MGNKYPWTWCNWVFPVWGTRGAATRAVALCFPAAPHQCRISSSVVSALQICLYFSTACLAFEWERVSESTVMSLEEILPSKTSWRGSQLVWELSASFQLYQSEYYAQGKGNQHPWLGLLAGELHPAREWGGSNALSLLTGNWVTTTHLHHLNISVLCVWKNSRNAGSFLVGLKWWSPRTW